MDIRELKAKITDLSLEKKDLIVRLEISKAKIQEEKNRCLDLSEKLIEARTFIVELGETITDHKDKIMNRKQSS